MKAILVMEMPENCKECDLCYQRSLCVAVKDDSGCCCGGEIMRAVPGVGIPDWCPLGTIPDLKTSEVQHDFAGGFVCGFNDCLGRVIYPQKIGGENGTGSN